MTKEDLAGKTIGVATSTTHFNYADKTYTDSTIKGYPSSQEEQLDLANGRLDAIKDDIVVLEAMAEDAGRRLLQAARHAHPQPVPKSMGRARASRCARARPIWSSKFNAAIDAIRANGKYKEINDKYFKFDVYGAES